MSNKPFVDQAAVAAMQSLIATSTLCPEDIANDAVVFAEFLDQRLHARKEVEEEVAPDAPLEINDIYFFPRMVRNEFRPQRDTWRSEPKQCLRRQLGLVTRDELEAIEICKKLNLATNL